MKKPCQSAAEVERRHSQGTWHPIGAAVLQSVPDGFASMLAEHAQSFLDVYSIARVLQGSTECMQKGLGGMVTTNTAAN